MRDIVENSIITTLMKHSRCLDRGAGGLWLEGALVDCCKTEAKIEAGFNEAITALVRDMIRESGDRGTSILNYLTNLCLFLAAMSLLMDAVKISSRFFTTYELPCPSNSGSKDQAFFWC